MKHRKKLKPSEIVDKKARAQLKRSIPWRWVINGVVLVALAYIVYAQWRQFGGSIHRTMDASPGLVLVGIGCIFATYMIAALQYQVLAQKPLKYVPTWIVQLAGALANRILPAGLGGLGLNADYLHRNGHSVAAAGVVAGTNNLLGIIMHVLLVTVLTLVGGSVLDFSMPTLPGWLPAIITGVLLIVVAVLAVFPRARHWLRVAMNEIKGSITYYRKHPWRLGVAACTALLVSVCFIVALMAAIHALGGNLSFGQAAIVMTIGVLVGTATPTPGGVVGAEAGLAAGLIAYGVASQEAIAIAILYRAISYWIPLVFGALAFVIAQKKHYI